MTQTWSVVKFPDENSVEVVPTAWLTEEYCYWPTAYAEHQVRDAISKLEHPQPHWQKYPYNHLRNNVFDSFHKATAKANKAKYSSDLGSGSETEVRTKRKIIRKVVSSSFEEDMEEELNIPSPPQLTKAILKKKDTTLNSTVIPDKVTNTTSKNANACPSNVSNSNTTPIGPDNNSMSLYIKEIIRNQNILKGMISDVLRRMDALEEKLKAPIDANIDNGESSIFQKLILPIDSDHDLGALEDYLQGEEEMKSAIKELCSFGGKDIYDFIYRSTEKLITNKYGAQFSLLGRKQKRSFKTLKMYQLILKAGMKVFQITEKEVEVNISKWLRRCNERSKLAESKLNK